MVIDDEELLTRTFARLLEKKGYEVLVATHSEDALAMAEEEDFDLILCDIRMPGRNGVETIREMRTRLKESGKPEVPTIFLTGFADDQLEEEARTLNPIAYIFKPFDAAQLLNTIEGVVA
jgi:CheY-like chemotaxis protein